MLPRKDPASTTAEQMQKENEKLLKENKELKQELDEKNKDLEDAARKTAQLNLQLNQMENKKLEDQNHELLTACKGWNKHCSEIDSGWKESLKKLETLAQFLREYEKRILQQNKIIKMLNEQNEELLKERTGLQSEKKVHGENREEMQNIDEKLFWLRQTNIQLILKQYVKSSVVWDQRQRIEVLDRENKNLIETIHKLMGQDEHLKMLLKFKCKKNCASLCLLHICKEIGSIHLCENKLHNLAVLSCLQYNLPMDDLVECAKSFELFNRCGFLKKKGEPMNVNGLDDLRTLLIRIENSLKEENKSQAAVLAFSFQGNLLGHCVILGDGKMFDPHEGEVDIANYGSASSVQVSVVNIDEIKRMIGRFPDHDPNGTLSCSHGIHTNSLDHILESLSLTI